MKFNIGDPVYIAYPNGTIREAIVVGEQNSLSLKQAKLRMQVGEETKDTIAEVSQLVLKTESSKRLVDMILLHQKKAQSHLQVASGYLAKLYSC